MEGIEIKIESNCLLVICRGEITIEVTGEMRQTVEDNLHSQTFEALVLDLSGVRFMDSSGIGSLVALNSKIKSSGKDFYILSPSDQVRKTLELVQLLSFFHIVDTKEELELLLPE
ncbi:MAG: anti-sigma factor antagonist [Desulfovibrionales bacterium]|jgi:anti-sigma B factor antagonist|nr:anti-sigma factor antagonist [Desulfovibrionales bacterium]